MSIIDRNRISDFRLEIKVEGPRIWAEGGFSYNGDITTDYIPDLVVTDTIVLRDVTLTEKMLGYLDTWNYFGHSDLYGSPTCSVRFYANDVEITTLNSRTFMDRRWRNRPSGI